MLHNLAAGVKCSIIYTLLFLNAILENKKGRSWFPRSAFKDYFLLPSTIPPAVASSPENSGSDTLNYLRTLRRIARFGLRAEPWKANDEVVLNPPLAGEGSRNNTANGVIY
ncbi:MAG: hypothetical protein NT136_01595 [Candidatus Moranbacteria bacterium]|nr:hypothetical protein [Candidatus Moranbacteria bacterium]